MKLKLGIFLLLSNFLVHPTWAQTNTTRDNFYFSLAEYAYVTLDLKITQDTIELFKNKKSIPEKEFKQKRDALLCATGIFYDHYRNFIQNVSYIPSEKLTAHLNYRKEELEEEFKKEKPDCESREFEKYYKDTSDQLMLKINEIAKESR
ncbi:hypothetical protein FSC12_01855 [Acinetobacter schindleri]|uniref:hypothetical protein n=1 Tax=Acinetobacter schindleri TaxID=108981 RepID=UPI0013B0A4A2|nr:hypothetical protein [Acinetobacter schindleri]QIC60181.1 hypothetical protein FSC12_01855 [Acinetobacter schindleri]